MSPQHRRRRRKHAVLSSLITCSLITPALSFWPFPSKRFTGNSLIAAGSLGLDGDSRVIAFGDFNGDQYLDVLALKSDQQTISVHHWSHTEFSYKETASFQHPRRIQNIVPGDFTHTGKLDLLVMSESHGDELEMTLYPASPSGSLEFRRPMAVPSSTLSQPIAVDTDGDMKIDLLGMTPSSSKTSEPFRLWQNVWNASQADSSLFNVITPDFKGKQCTISHPHSNAVVDLNGDCLADIFLVCDDGRGSKSYQIWLNNKEDGFSLSQEGSLPSNLQTISFADMDRDGTIDMVLTTCSRVSSSSGVGNDCYINIAYNRQYKLCESSTDSGVRHGIRTCRRHSELCTSDPNFKFDLRNDPGNDLFTRIPLSSLYPDSSGLLVLDTSFAPPVPIPLRLGDANLDGFPDFLAIISAGQHRTPSLVFSVPCAAGVVGCSSSGEGRRGFQVATKGVESLHAINDARAVSFLDLDEDGTLDIMVQRTGDAGQGKILFVQNNIYYDAFFLKAIVLNGACGNGWCNVPNSSERYHPFGVSYPGASYKYTVLDTSGHRSAAQVGQLPQTSYHSLQTPYSFFGLGRTNNYIENLFVGSTIHAKEHYINMEGVIPNSKVVILPSAREDEPWKRELFLRPGEWIPWVTVTVVVGTGLLAVIVFILHLNEKREDELERRRASHRINFDAL